MNETIYYFLILLGSGWAISFFYGFLSLPITQRFYSEYEDGGFNLGKIISLFLVGFIYFTIVTISSFLPYHFLQLNSIYSILVSILLFIAFQKLFFNKEIFIEFYKIKFKEIIKNELIFLVILSFFLLINTHFHLQVNSEQIMNIGIFRAIQSQTNLPIKDFWYSGEFFNYYYFGHLVFSQFQAITQIDTSIIYYLYCSLIPALLGTSTYIFVTKFTKKLRLFYFLILFFLTPLNAVIDFLLVNYKDLNQIILLFYLNTIKNIPKGISENYSYTTTNIPIHAHVFGLLLGTIIIYQLFLIFSLQDEVSLWNKKYQFLFIIFGLSTLTNTWDLIFYFSLFIFLYFITFLKKLTGNYKKTIVKIEILFLIPILMLIPWIIFYRGPSIGIGFVKESSNLIQFLNFWQVYLIIIGTYLVINYFYKKEKFSSFFNFCFLFSIMVLVIMEILFFVDGTQDRYNTYYKFSNQILLIFSILSYIYFSKLIEISKFYLIKFILSFIIIFSSLGFFIYLIFKLNFNDTFMNSNINMITKYSYSKQTYKSNFYEVYNFLNSYSFKTKNKIVIEYSGFGYKNTNNFAPLLGFQNILGWRNHEITWRYNYDVYLKINKRYYEIIDIYSGYDLNLAKKNILKYDAELLILGPNEISNIPNIKYQKIDKLGNVIFSNQDFKIYELNK